MNSYKKIFIILGVTILIIIGAIFVFTYVVQLNSPVIVQIRKVLRLPAITVDNQWISLAELEENTESIKRFYENQDFSQFGIRIDFDTEDGQKRLQLQQRKMINKLIEDIAIEKKAKEWNITISDEAVKTAMNRPMNEMGSKKDVELRLKKLYGWSLDDFGQKVVKGQLLREKVEQKFKEQNTITQEMINKINKAKKELDDNRVFADIAKKYSEGSTAQEGGIMGWFADGQLQDEIGKEIFSMQKGDYTDAIETPLGLHIVKIDDISEVDGKKLVHVSQIVVKRNTFADFLNEEISKMNVKVFLPQYRWDADSALIVFTDEKMTEFEDKIQKEAIEAQKEFLETQKE